MPGDEYLSVPSTSDNPAPLKKLGEAEFIRAELARVDAAIAELSVEIPGQYNQWRILGEVSVPIAIRSIRHYRQRLVLRLIRTGQ